MAVFEIERAKKISDRLRKRSGELSNLAWALDERLRCIRIAEIARQTPEAIADLTVLANIAAMRAERELDHGT